MTDALISAQDSGPGRPRLAKRERNSSRSVPPYCNYDAFECRGRPQTHLSPLERLFWALFGLLSLPRHAAPLGPVMRTDSRPLDDFLKVNSTASPSLRLRKPSMCTSLRSQLPQLDPNMNPELQLHGTKQTANELR
ncbi:hypothetical protein EYF80_003618 [Liparis tanakae]|uniref:Uncharacterized protein n=1 Tax=Liparis tanakae TaxID=230148 RepID=A0A4Z2J8G4_9TELE|nr:hypothetical protein EYF80_003618 [Liparis tanakae]